MGADETRSSSYEELRHLGAGPAAPPRHQPSESDFDLGQQLQERHCLRVVDGAATTDHVARESQERRDESARKRTRDDPPQAPARIGLSRKAGIFDDGYHRGVTNLANSHLFVALGER